MTTILLTFGIFLLVTVAMAVGYIFQKKSISGSCGGLGAIGVDKACDCPEPCDRRKAREAKEAARAEKLAQWKQDQIL
jgi:hypothetical protein